MAKLVDSIAVLVFILINVVIGFFQEYRAEKAVLILQKFIPQKIKILRDSKEEIIDAKFLVPGDIVLLEAGDLAPADLRVINVQNFLTDESALTGESVPVSKIAEAFERKKKKFLKQKILFFPEHLLFREKQPRL